MASNENIRTTLGLHTNISKDGQVKKSAPLQNITSESGNSLSACVEGVDGNLESDHSSAVPHCYEEDYFSLWHKNHHGSIDLGLDEKLTSMTGSYSEILDESQHEESESDNAQTNNASSACVHTELEDKRKGMFNVKEVPRGANPKIIKAPDNTTASIIQWNENNTKPENICSLAKDLSEKSSISSHPSKRKECVARNMTSSQNMPRSLLYPSIPPIDPTVISDLEDQARHIATSMDTLIENLTGTLHSISALSVECVETYRDAVCKTCDAVDSNIKSMYQLMAKCEELSKSMKPMYKLHDQIKEIRRLLDLFESAVYSGGT